LVIQPTGTGGMADSFAKDRLAPMLRDTPALKGKVKDPRSRDSNNTTLHKKFPGGHITIVGANSPAALASRPIRICLFDEVDRYPASAGSEGDPIQLARKRAATFWNRKVVMVSTPTNKGASRIEAAYEATDQRHYFVPCHDCGEFEPLKWANIHWQKDEPETATYVCEHCGSAWDDAARQRAIKKGEWRGSEPFSGIAGFSINGLYSPWMSMAEAVREFLAAKRLPETLRVWVNTFLGESWEDAGEQIDDFSLAARRETYNAEVPAEVVMLTAGVDVQDDRLHCEILGHGRDEESWSIKWHTIYGDPTSRAVWDDLDDIIRAPLEHERLGEMTIRATCIDSGHHTNAVYAFCKPREGRRVWAVKGVGGEGKALAGKPTRNNVGKLRLFPIGVNTAKELVFGRLRIQEPGPGYCHFPVEYEDEFFKQLTAEKCVTKFHKGFPRREWVKTRPRNDVLDCRVYATGAFAILNMNINRVADRQAQQRNEPAPSESMSVAAMQRAPAKRGRGGGGNWATGWR
jgi:phage terminase large subunit GpA-like protein